MGTLIRQILEYAPQDYVTDTELKFLLDGATDASRYNRVVRAISNEDLIAIRKGLYVLPKAYQRKGLNLYSLAQKVYGPSYISMESALSYHGWIPEAVYSVTNACVKRSRVFETPLANFYYTHVPIPAFMLGVERVQVKDDSFLMASPLKAITDYIYKNRLDWKGLDPLIESLRIDPEDLRFSLEEILELSRAYGSSRISKFLKGLRKDLHL